MCPLRQKMLFYISKMCCKICLIRNRSIKDMSLILIILPWVFRPNYPTLAQCDILDG